MRFFLPVVMGSLLGAAAGRADEPAAATPDTPSKLKPGEFEWHPERSESGPVLMVVSRDDQVMYVYRNAIEIARSTISTGKKGHDTPTGVFQILQKHKDHYSSIYKGAAMPYMQRLTWQGIALHAGNLPGYPASHGCVRLPHEFSKKLYGVTEMGGTVVVTSVHSAPKNSMKPYEIMKAGGKDLKDSGAVQPFGEEYVVAWHPEKQTDGHLAIVFSYASRMVHVLRNGVEIGRAEVGMSDIEDAMPTGIFVMLDKELEEDSAIVEGKKRKAWAMVALDGKSTADEVWAFAGKLDVPQNFASAVYDELEPGTLFVFTPEALDPDKRSETGFVVAAGEGGVKEKE